MFYEIKVRQKLSTLAQVPAIFLVLFFAFPIGAVDSSSRGSEPAEELVIEPEAVIIKTGIKKVMINRGSSTGVTKKAKIVVVSQDGEWLAEGIVEKTHSRRSLILITKTAPSQTIKSLKGKFVKFDDWAKDKAVMQEEAEPGPADSDKGLFFNLSLGVGSPLRKEDRAVAKPGFDGLLIGGYKFGSSIGAGAGIGYWTGSGKTVSVTSNIGPITIKAGRSSLFTVAPYFHFSPKIGSLLLLEEFGVGYGKITVRALGLSASTGGLILDNRLSLLTGLGKRISLGLAVRVTAHFATSNGSSAKAYFLAGGLIVHYGK